MGNHWGRALTTIAMRRWSSIVQARNVEAVLLPRGNRLSGLHLIDDFAKNVADQEMSFLNTGRAGGRNCETIVDDGSHFWCVLPGHSYRYKPTFFGGLQRAQDIR